jgi:hypothetical protein
MDGRDIPELSPTEKARWIAVTSALRGMAESARDGSLDAEGAEATLGQIRQIELDMARIRDSLHVPEDAGAHRKRLIAMLLRIPDGWGRWIECDAGWYPIIVNLDDDLVALDPVYEIQQVKEKYGTLRFYASTQVGDDQTQDRFRELIAAAEQRSAGACERCGAPGELMRSARRWYKTLCPRCARAIGSDEYQPLEQR